MEKGKEEALELANRIYDIITRDYLKEEEKDLIVKESVENFRDHVNPGFLEYRKSVSTDATFVEWEEHGASFSDTHGIDFLDCLGGNGVFLCGHKNPEILKAVHAQLDRYALNSQELLDPLRGYLAKLMATITPGDLQYCFFTNGGTEAVEMALKLSRLATGKTWIISTVGGFHGKTMGSLSATGKAVYRKPYMPLVPGFLHVEYGDSKAVEKAIKNLVAVGETVAGLIVEPIQGEAGVIIPPDNYFPELREICDKYEVCLIADEIQTGMGRTGTLWAVERWNVVPDILVFGKAFGGGVMPITGIIARPPLWKNMVQNPLILGSPTYGGNPIGCAAAIAAIKYILENDVPRLAEEKGDYLLNGLKEVQKKHSILVDVRGRGLMLGLEYPSDAIGYAVSKGLFQNRIMVAGYLNNARVFRMEPPVVITYPELDRVISTIDKVLSEVEEKEIA